MKSKICRLFSTNPWVHQQNFQIDQIPRWVTWPRWRNPKISTGQPLPLFRSSFWVKFLPRRFNVCKAPCDNINARLGGARLGLGLVGWLGVKWEVDMASWRERILELFLELGATLKSLHRERAKELPSGFKAAQEMTWWHGNDEFFWFWPWYSLDGFLSSFWWNLIKEP